ncbi:MAG: nucleotide-binding protein [Byssovorax sp.]
MRRSRALAVLFAASVMGCGGGGEPSSSSSASTSTGATGTGGAGGAGGSGGGAGTTSTTGGTGGTGGASLCNPGAQEACYTGPFGTEGVGECKGGMKTCNADGSAFGPCMGEITPVDETCVTPGDENCDGHNNEGGEGCVCIPGSLKLCYSGPAGTQDIGICLSGVLTCTPEGTGYGPCEGEVVPMAEDCATPADEDCDGETPLCPALWAIRAGDASGQFAWGLAVDGAGNPIVVGDLDGTMNLGAGLLTSAGSTDVVVAKLDGATGAAMWSKSFGNASLQSGQAVAVDAAGAVAITGYFQGSINFGGGALASAGGADIYLAKLDAAGNHLWSKRFGSATDDQLGLAIAFDPDGNVVVTGSFNGTMNFGGGNLVSAGGADIFVAKYDGMTGNHLWSKSFGDAQLDQAGRGITCDSVGNVIVTGGFEGTVNFGGGALASAGGLDAFLVKLDGMTGSHVWSQRFGDVGYQTGRSVAADAAGNLFVGGDFEGSLGASVSAGGYDMFVVSLDSSGAVLSSLSIGGAGYDSLSSIAASGGDVAVTGYLDGPGTAGMIAVPSAGGRDIFIGRLSAADLTPIWARSFGDPSFFQAGTGVGLDPTGNLLFAGYFVGSVDFGMGPLTSAGGADLFVAKLAP